MTAYLESWICCGNLCEEYNNSPINNNSSSMGEEELHCLRAVNQKLEHDMLTLMEWNRHLEKELTTSREQFEGERVLVKCLKKDIESEIKLAREMMSKKYERSLAEMKIRMELEQRQSLELQKQQLEREFRSDLMKFIHKKDSQLHLLFTHSKQVQRETDQKLTADRLHYHASYEMYLQRLKQDFKRQLTRLVQELKGKERKIGILERSIATHITPPSCHIPANQVTITATTTAGSNGCLRSKSYYRGSGVCPHHPYLTDARKKRHDKMKETDDFQRDDDCNQLYVLHQYGGFPLETLPEVSEDESKPEESNLSSHRLKSSSLKLTRNDNNTNHVRCNCESQLSDEFGIQIESSRNEKLSSLEATIRQLQDELRESKEQNELLEFRLLELEEFEPPTSRVTDESPNVENRVDELLSSSEVVLCGAEVPSESEVTNNADYDESSNSHSSVAESRSSCSDCSESLSLQESGIFENQFSEEQSGSTSRSEEVGRELATLASQIESLVLSFREDVGNGNGNGEFSLISEFSTPLHRLGKIGMSRLEGGRSSQHDFPSDLKFCRQRIQEFEKRLTKFTDVTYMRSLEDKVNSLIQENRRLEEERSELEEAENDSRHQFQRLEEKMKELRAKNSLLQQQLSNEKRYIEQLRIQILQLQEGEEELCTQLSRVESLAQNYEQRNFELEESQIEIKCTLQVMLHSLPLLILWHLWHYQRQQQPQQRSISIVGAFRAIDHERSSILISPPPPPLPTSTPPLSSRKHKLKTEMTITMIEPKLKKLRSEKEKSWCTLCREVGKEPSISTSSMLKCNSKIILDCVESQTQTTEDWYLQLVTQHGRVDEFYKTKITRLECEMNRCEQLFASEKQQLLEQHRIELEEKTAEAYQKYVESQKEKVHLEKRWEGLIKELEQFSSSIAENLHEVPVTLKRDEINTNAGSSNEMSRPFSPISDIKGGKVKGESLVANRIRNLFPDEWLCLGKVGGRHITPTKNPLSDISSNRSGGSSNSKIGLIRKLEERFEDKQRREKVLMDEIDGLKSDLKEKLKSSNNNKEIIHLSEENNRLQMILSEQESIWLSVKELEDENEKLTAELTSNVSLQKRRLDESLTTEKNLRQHIEELEQNELHLREAKEESERKGRKCIETLHTKLNFFSEEAEFLRSKCSQLQDDLSSKSDKENKLKLDIQLLTSKLELNSTTLDEREQLLESTELTLRSQISKLRDELNDVHQQLGDSECSNGMLSEEIEALERALQESVENTNKNEIQVKILKSDMEMKTGVLMDLQKELDLIKQGEETGYPNPNDLDVFAKNEGGLTGVKREVKDVMEILQGDGQVSNLLTRCESEEQLLNPPVDTTTEKHQEVSLGLHEIAEENLSLKSQIAQLQTDLTVKEKKVRNFSESIVQLQTQLSASEDSFVSREKSVKECHLNEYSLWEARCKEKNDLIHLLARRLAHLSVTDMHDYFLNGILKEIRHLRDSSYSTSAVIPRVSLPIYNEPETPQDCNSLLNYISAERRRIMDLLKSTCDEMENQLDSQHHFDSRGSVDFRVLRRIGEESLLVSWTIPEIPRGKIDGYEISVNGNTFLRIPPNRYKALLFGLDMSEPLQLSLKCTGAFKLQESSITYIA